MNSKKTTGTAAPKRRKISDLASLKVPVHVMQRCCNHVSAPHRVYESLCLEELHQKVQNLPNIYQAACTTAHDAEIFKNHAQPSNSIKSRNT